MPPSRPNNREASLRIVGVTRILNEAALVEPFVRHHATLFDLHILLDNGSTDDTLPILQRLRQEGLALHVYQSISPIFMEVTYNTGLYRLALGEAADWVAFVDCDELLDARRAPGGLRPWLAASAADTIAWQVPMLDHLAPTPATATLANPFERLVRRRPDATLHKVLVRGLPDVQVVIGGGAHHAVVGWTRYPGVAQDAVVLAHYPARSPAQMTLKAAVGRLKVLADGQANAHLQHNSHLADPFEALKRSPRRWIAEVAQTLDAAQTELAEEPSPYQGGALRYTQPQDDDARLVALLLTYAERLAQSHGRLLDRSGSARRAVLAQGTALHRLF